MKTFELYELKAFFIANKKKRFEAPQNIQKPKTEQQNSNQTFKLKLFYSS